MPPWLSFPFHIISSLVRFLFSLLRIPVPQFRFSSLIFFRSLRSPNPPRTPHIWLRDLEDETGARARSTAISIPGPSSLRTRAGESKLLPDFMLTSYDDFLKKCQTDVRFGCVILVSDEHDNVAEFKRTTLTDPSFVNILYENNFLVWGGDVRDPEAWSAAQKLQATTYPFVAFVALQHRRSPSSVSHLSSPSPTLTVLSRHSGPSTPSTAPTSPTTLSTHLSTHLLPRITPSLTRIHTAFLQRERDRLLREEQDRAFQDSARRDMERIEAMMVSERQALESRRQREESERYENEKMAREADAQLQREAQRMEWRRWARKSLVLPESPASGLRIAIRLPSNPRVIHKFSPSATLTSLFTFIDTLLIPSHLPPSSDPSSPPSNASSSSIESAIEAQIPLSGSSENWWGFKLMLAYPRREISWEAQKPIVDVDDLKGGGQVVVEMIGGSRHGSIHRPRKMSDHDGYSTEESD